MSQLILQPFFCFSYVTGFSLTSPGEPPMLKVCNGNSDRGRGLKLSVPGGERPESCSSRWEVSYGKRQLRKTILNLVERFNENILRIIGSVNTEELVWMLLSYDEVNYHKEWVIVRADTHYKISSTRVQHKVGSRDEMRWSPYIVGPWVARVPADHAWRTITRADETKWMRWVWRNGGNKLVVRENGRNPVKNLPRPRFVHHETHVEGPRRELGTPAVGEERLTAYATRPQHSLLKMSSIYCNTLLTSSYDISNHSRKFFRTDRIYYNIV